jgi:hypothetical protein
MSYFSIQILYPVRSTAQEIQNFKVFRREQLDFQVLHKVKKFRNPCFLLMVLLLLCVDRDLSGTDLFYRLFGGILLRGALCDVSFCLKAW